MRLAAAFQTEGTARNAASQPGFLYWSGLGLVGVSWISAAAFGLYILRFYLASAAARQFAHWNDNLTGLYEPHFAVALLAIAAHMASGAVLLLLGPVQLIAAVRRRWPAMHRWLGRAYVLTAAVAGVGGLVFIVSRGTVGGWPVNLGFGLYGVLVVLSAEESCRHGRARRLEAHRAWSVRLFALTIGSWLYRMDYGFWLLAMRGLWHREDFHGPFDAMMAFWFYVPNLLLAELYLRGRRWPSNSSARVATALLLNAATLIIAVGTYYFVRFYWGSAILHGAV